MKLQLYTPRTLRRLTAEDLATAPPQTSRLRHRLMGRAAQQVEVAFTTAWSVSETLYAMRRPGRVLRPDPFRDAVLEDLNRHGLHKPTDDEVQTVTPDARGRIKLRNPYARLDDGPPDDVVAVMRNVSRKRQRRLLIMCHCYGLPVPPLMARVFGLDRLYDHDVVYNLMNHHYPGSYRVWPGFGLLSLRMSRLVENIRSAITGLRTLARSLQATYGYERVSVLGYSIGGFLGLHLASQLPISPLILYCPVVSLHDTVHQLGLLPHITPRVTRSLERLRDDFSAQDLRLLDPLNTPLTIPPRDVMVFAQSRDVMVYRHQLTALRHAMPQADWLEYDGTHTWPDRPREIQRHIRAKLSSV